MSKRFIPRGRVSLYELISDQSIRGSIYNIKHGTHHNLAKRESKLDTSQAAMLEKMR